MKLFRQPKKVSWEAQILPLDYDRFEQEGRKDFLNEIGPANPRNGASIIIIALVSQSKVNLMATKKKPVKKKAKPKAKQGKKCSCCCR
jgi:hypothetical protein